MKHIKGLVVIMCLFCLFTSIGYAQLSGTLTIEGSVTVEEPDGIYIQNAVAADQSDVTVTQYVGNILTVNVEPNVSDAVVTITIKNNSTTDLYLLDVLCPENITCDKDLPVGMEFKQGEAKDFIMKLSHTAAQAASATLTIQFTDVPSSLGGDNQQHTNATQVINFIINDLKVGLNSQSSLLRQNCNQARPVLWCKENATTGGNLDGIYGNEATSHVLFMMEYIDNNKYNIYILDLNVENEIDKNLEGRNIVVYKQEVIKNDTGWVAGQSSKGYAKIAELFNVYADFSHSGRCGFFFVSGSVRRLGGMRIVYRRFRYGLV